MKRHHYPYDFDHGPVEDCQECVKEVVRKVTLSPCDVGEGCAVPDYCPKCGRGFPFGWGDVITSEAT